MLAVGLIAGAPGAAAQEAPLERLYACPAIADDVQRLVCFDGAVAGLKQAETGGDVAVVSRQQIQKVEKEAFGLAMPSLPALTAATGMRAVEKPVQLDRVSLAVKSIRKTGDGKVELTMENGQIWRQTDTSRLASLGKGPWTAHIRKAALGSFFLNIDNRTAIKAKRVE